jgi:hypothetical protein
LFPGAVFYYVATHIDEIKETQRITTQKTMAQQSSDIRNAQETQRRAIEEVRMKQEEAIRKIAEDAAKRRAP